MKKETKGFLSKPARIALQIIFILSALSFVLIILTNTP